MKRLLICFIIVFSNVFLSSAQTTEMKKKEKLDVFKEKIREKEKTIDTLQNEICSLKIDLELSSDKNKALSDSVDFLNVKIRTRDTELDSLKKQLELAAVLKDSLVLEVKKQRVFGMISVLDRQYDETEIAKALAIYDEIPDARVKKGYAPEYEAMQKYKSYNDEIKNLLKPFAEQNLNRQVALFIQKKKSREIFEQLKLTKYYKERYKKDIGTIPYLNRFIDDFEAYVTQLEVFNAANPTDEQKYFPSILVELYNRL